ncbi:MAG: AAA family ATPase [Byssovorax sp.]
MGWAERSDGAEDSPAPAAPEPAGETGAPMLLGRPTPFLGRDDEVALVRAAAREALEKRAARAILVTGEAGIGKTRLCREALAGLAIGAGRLTVWAGRGEPVSAGSPFGLIGSAIRGAAGIAPGEPIASQQHKLRALASLRLGAAEGARVAEFLGEIAGIPFEETTSVRLSAARRSPGLMGDQMQRAWVDFLCAECEAGPVALLLEDVHSGDRPSLRLIEAALREEALPLVVLGAGRAEVHGRFPAPFGAKTPVEVRLGGLPDRSAERLVRDALGRQATPRLIAAIVARASGNPFFLEELIRGAAQGRADELPESVLAVLRERLDLLSPEARHVLCAASVFGSAFDREGVIALVGDEIDVDRVLPALEQDEIIHPRDRRWGDRAYAFRHATMCEAAYALLSEADRSLGHRLAAEHLIERGASDARLLAEHFERGGEQERALAAATAPPSTRSKAATPRRPSPAPSAPSHAARRARSAGSSTSPAPRRTAGGIATPRASAAPRAGDRGAPPGRGAWCAAVSELAACAFKLGDPGRLESLAALLGEEIAACARRPRRRSSPAPASRRPSSSSAATTPRAPCSAASTAPARRWGAPPRAGAHLRDPGHRRLLRGRHRRGHRPQRRGHPSFAEVGDLRSGGAGVQQRGRARLGRRLPRGRGGAAPGARRGHAPRVAADPLRGAPEPRPRARRAGPGGGRDEPPAPRDPRRHRPAESAPRGGRAHLPGPGRAPIGAARRRRGRGRRRREDGERRRVPAGVRARGARGGPARAGARRGGGDRRRARHGDPRSPRRRMEEGEAIIRLSHIEIALAEGRRADAEIALVRALDRLRQRAVTMRDEGLRRSFLEVVAEHRRLSALADELLAR